MKVFFTNPHPALRRYVNGYFYIELDAGPTSIPLDIHPVGYNTMAFTLNPRKVFRSAGGDYDFSLSYHGYICKHIPLIPLVPFIKMVVVSFTATGAAQLFRVGQHELVNQIHPIESVIPSGWILKTQLEEGISCGKRATGLIEKWLLKQIPTKSVLYYATHIDHACKLIQSRHGNLRIQELCKDVGMSQTNLEDHFKAMIGTSPKLYCRIARFIASYRFILQNTHVEWCELAYRYGFFDQSHFIREFKSFFGYSPSKIHMANSHLPREIILDV